MVQMEQLARSFAPGSYASNTLPAGASAGGLVATGGTTAPAGDSVVIGGRCYPRATSAAHPAAASYTISQRAPSGREKLYLAWRGATRPDEVPGQALLRVLLGGVCASAPGVVGGMLGGAAGVAAGVLIGAAAPAALMAVAEGVHFMRDGVVEEEVQAPGTSSSRQPHKRFLVKEASPGERQVLTVVEQPRA